jgi:exosortase
MSVPSIRTLWKPAAIIAAISFLYLSVLMKLGHDWWTDENYSHGLLVPLIIGFMLWTERARLWRAIRASQPSLWLGGVCLMLAIFALWAGTAGAELYVQRMSLVLLLAGIVIYFWGFHLLRLTFVSFVLLVLAIPIPAIIFNQVAFPLQLFASRCAVWAMRFFDIPVLRQGNVIELLPLGARETKKLEVVEACSGIRSLMTLITLAVVFAYFTRPKSDDKNDGDGGAPLDFLKRWGFWRALILVSSAIPIAILTNAARVSGTGILAHYYGLEVADGFFHSFSGWVVYIVAFMLLFAVGWVLDRFNGRGPGKGGGASAAEAVKDEKKASARGVSATAAPAASPAKAVTVKGAE